MQLTLAGVVVPAPNILYAGLAPGYAGLYQINLRLPDVLAGEYVLLSVGDTVCLSRLGENPAGHLCPTNWLVDVPIADLCLFIPTGLQVELLEE